MSLAIYTLNESLTTDYAHNETFSVITENYFIFLTGIYIVEMEVSEYDVRRG